MYWLIGVAAWYALAAAVVRQIPRMDSDDFVDGMFRISFWMMSPAVFLFFVVPAAFARYALTSRSERHP